MPAEPGGVHAQEAATPPREGGIGGPYQVLQTLGAVHKMGTLKGLNSINKKIF